MGLSICSRFIEVYFLIGTGVVGCNERAAFYGFISKYFTDVIARGLKMVLVETGEIWQIITGKVREFKTVDGLPSFKFKVCGTYSFLSKFGSFSRFFMMISWVCRSLPSSC